MVDLDRSSHHHGADGRHPSTESDVRDRIRRMRSEKQQALAKAAATNPEPHAHAEHRFLDPSISLRAEVGRPTLDSQRISQVDPRLLTWYADDDADVVDDDRADAPQSGGLKPQATTQHSSSSGHGEDSSSASAEDTVLGHGTMASLLNPTFSPRSIAETQSHISEQSNRSRQHSLVAMIGDESDSAPSFDSVRQSFDSLASSSTRMSPRSPTSSPSISTLSARKRSGSRASTGSSYLGRPISPRGPPPNVPLPSLPPGIQGGRQSVISIASSSRSGGSQSSRARSVNRNPPPTEPLPDLPLSQASSSPTRASFSSSHYPGSIVGSTSAPRSAFNSRPPSQSSSSTRDRLDSRAPSRAASVRVSASHPWVGDMSGAEDTEAKGPSHRRDYSLQAILDEAEQEQTSLSLQGPSSSSLRIESVSPPSDAGTVQLYESREGQVPSRDVGSLRPRELATSSPHNAARSSNGSFVALYERPTAPGSDTADEVAGHSPNEDLPPRTVTVSPGTPQAETNGVFPQPQAPMISIDEVDSSNDSAGGLDSDAEDNPRKKPRQKLRSKSQYSFDSQRAAAPSTRGNSSKPSSLAASKSGAASADSAGAQQDPFAFYSFSPELPPFVPQGLRPIDLTGRGTWMSIAARASSANLTMTRANSIASFHSSIADSIANTDSSNAGPVSMRQIAAEARAKQKSAKEFTERQASLLAQKTWQPAELHALAEEQQRQGLDSPKQSLRTMSSAISQPRSSSHTAPGIHFPPYYPWGPSAGEEGIAYNFTPLSSHVNLHRALSVGSRMSQATATSEASVGEGADIVGLGIGRSSSGNIKQYREFSQQTTPRASPEPEEEPHSREIGVGGNDKELGGSQAKRFSQLEQTGGVGSDIKTPRGQGKAIASYGAWTSADEDDDVKGSRAATPTQQPPRKNAPRRRRTTIGATKSVGASNEADETWPPLNLRTPRLTSRKSNIGTSSNASQQRNSTLSIAGDRSDSTIAAKSQLAAVDDSSEDDDSDASAESDLDLATPARDLAARTGAFDAIVQARGAKRKLKQPVHSSRILLKPGSARPIAGTGRLFNHSPRKPQSDSPPQNKSGDIERKDVDVLAKEIETLAVSLSSPPPAVNAVLRVPGSLAPSTTSPRRSLPAPRAESPDLEESFAVDRRDGDDHDDDDDENESLMLSEMEFPAPVSTKHTVERYLSGHKVSPHRFILDSLSTKDNGSSSSLGGKDARDVSLISEKEAPAETAKAMPGSPHTSEINDTPLTNTGSEAWSTLADSNRASTSTAVTDWSRSSRGSQGSIFDGEEKLTEDPTSEDKSSKRLESATVGLPKAAGRLQTPKISSAEAERPLLTSPDGPRNSHQGLRPKLPSPRVSFAPGDEAQPKLGPRSSLPTASTRPGILKTSTSLRSPSSQLPTRASMLPQPPSGSPRTSGIRPPATSLNTPKATPALRKAASFASRPTHFEVVPTSIPQRQVASPPLSRYSAASPSMLVPSGSISPPSRSPSRSPVGANGVAARPRPSDPVTLRGVQPQGINRPVVVQRSRASLGASYDMNSQRSPHAAPAPSLRPPSNIRSPSALPVSVRR